MLWNWQLPDWPHFTYDPVRFSLQERQFLLNAGGASASLKNIGQEEKKHFIVEILSQEGLDSSKIEGEILQRESLQSSIKKHFGLQTEGDVPRKEQGMAELLINHYETYELPLTHEMLWKWHAMLFKDWSRLEDCGRYRTHLEPMQIVSGRLDTRTVYFEAPSSEKIHGEMTKFIEWYNADFSFETILGRAAIAHVYFESIHPFEDGNGRIGRVLAEKMLSQGVGQPILISLSKFIEKQKKGYYDELGKCNRSLEATHWVEFFADLVLKAQKYSMSLLQFLIKKSRVLTTLAGQLNPRQEKVLLRLFAEGPEGFKGGLSAEKYISITKASRATTTRDLADLNEKGVVYKTGELRHTRYWLTE